MSAGDPQTSTRWSRTKLAVVLFPFVAAAVAINRYFVSLLGTYFGIPVPSPVLTLLVALPLGVPASWAAARWVDHLLDKAEE